MPDDDDLVEVVITAPDEEWLIAFTRRLLERRLVACGHHTSIRSIYTWHGQIYDQPESHAALHTKAEHFDTIAALVNDEHPYELPCVVSTPIRAASASYRAWVLESVN